MRPLCSLVLISALFGAGCAHSPLTGAELAEVQRPAFISRIEEGAGPRSEVFRGDGSHAPRLKRLDPREADRRLELKLQNAMSRFEIAERLRATTAAALPAEPPWTRAVDPARVAQVLQSFLVQEVPANPPDYQAVGELGADAIVEFVIESYGLRSEDGHAGAYLLGYGRMFTLDGRELWRRNVRVDQLASGLPGMDPFEVAKRPELWREAMTSMLDAVARQFAADLSPEDRRASAAPAQPPAPAGEAEEDVPEELRLEDDSVTPGNGTTGDEGDEDPL